MLFRSSNKNGAYAGSKFGSVGLVQSFAKELVEDNTKVRSEERRVGKECRSRGSEKH